MLPKYKVHKDTRWSLLTVSVVLMLYYQGAAMDYTGTDMATTCN